MKTKVFRILSKVAISIASLFLWMYLMNLGLGFINASDDLLVVLGIIIALAVTVGFFMGNLTVWEKCIFTKKVEDKKEEK
jgi:hypothetical protein